MRRFGVICPPIEIGGYKYVVPNGTALACKSLRIKCLVCLRIKFDVFYCGLSHLTPSLRHQIIVCEQNGGIGVLTLVLHQNSEKIPFPDFRDAKRCHILRGLFFEFKIRNFSNATLKSRYVYLNLIFYYQIQRLLCQLQLKL
jgi:hypothetical protein